MSDKHERCSDCPRLWDTEGPVCDDCPPLQISEAHNPELDGDDPASMEGSYRPNFANKSKVSDKWISVKQGLPPLEVTESDRERAKIDNPKTNYTGRRFALMYYCRERQLCSLLRDNAVSDKWISANHSLPEDGQLCIMFGNGVVQHALYSLDSESGEWWPQDDDFDAAPFCTFTHWMPLPAPPETK